MSDKHDMYFVPEGTTRCGFYECEECGYRFLDIRTDDKIPCPYCSEDPDPEIGPDEELPAQSETAKLIQVLTGEDVEKYDTLLSLAATGGDFEWI